MAISAELDFVCVDVVYHHIGQKLALITHRNMHLAKLSYPAPALAPCLRKPRQTCAKHGRCLPGKRACPSTIEQTGFERDVGFYSEYREATQGEDDV